MSPTALGSGRQTHQRGGLKARPWVGFALAVFGLVVALLAGGRGGEASLVRAGTGGQVTVAPGQTLWDIAVTHAPRGSDPRAYLLRLRQRNGLDMDPVPAWTVVLLPET